MKNQYAIKINLLYSYFRHFVSVINSIHITNIKNGKFFLYQLKINIKNLIYNIHSKTFDVIYHLEDPKHKKNVIINLFST